MITRNWKLVGIGLLVVGFVRGCPQKIQQSQTPTEKRSLQSLETNGTPDLGDGIPSSLFRTPKTSLTPTRSSQSGQLSSIVRNQPVPNENTQSKSPQLSTILAKEKRAISFKKDQGESRDSAISLVQTTGNGNPDFTNQDPEPPAEVKDLQDSQTELKPQLVPVEKSEALSETPSNPTENNMYSSGESNIASQNPQISSPLIPSNTKNTSGNCDYPWEFDSSGNRCGDRAASERQNLIPGSTSNSYSSPAANRYSVPILSSGSTYVKPHMRNGHYVRGHYRRKR
jgi:hypothetical protein